MKLLDKYNRISLVTTVLVIIITGIVYYFTISFILTGQVDKDLLVEENEIFDYVKLNQRLPQVFKSEDLKIHFQQITADTVQRKFLNTSYRDEKDDEQETVRALVSSVKVKGVNYRIIIMASKVETEYLIRLIFLITLGIIFLLIVVLVIINRVVIRNLWKPFYEMLREIKLFNLTDQNTITGIQTGIDEFQDMNQEISAMSTRVRQDYRELKDFIENAAHELMTPIAVINSKLDTLLQTGHLNDEQGRLIGDMYSTVAKLTRLNKAMLLLTKIENNLITDQEPIDLKAAIVFVLSELQEMMESKNITLYVNLADARITISKTLLDILLNNLLSNAIRHNHINGVVKIKLDEHALIIQNTGKPDALHPQTIFSRFHKSADSEGSGLGLTIARQICENYDLQLHYLHQDHLHVFTILLNKQLV